MQESQNQRTGEYEREADKLHGIGMLYAQRPQNAIYSMFISETLQL